MGRPPLNVKTTVIRLTESTRTRIERLVGPHRMSAFVREAVESELTRRERAQQETPEVDQADDR